MAKSVAAALRTQVKNLQEFRRFGSKFSRNQVHTDVRRSKAATATIAQDVNEKEKANVPETSGLFTSDPAYSRIDVSFENAREAFKSKTNLELLRAYLVLQLCSVRPLVKKNKEVSCQRSGVIILTPKRAQLKLGSA